MMKLPVLKDWQSTRDSLHVASKLLSAIRKAIVGELPNALHLSLFVCKEGLTTGKTAKGEVILNFTTARFDYVLPDGAVQSIALNGETAEAVFDRLQTTISAVTDDILRAELKVDDAEFTFNIDATQGATYADALFTIYSALARFKARLFGTMTPLVVWSHHFDLSFLWFKGNVADEHNEAHLNFGFSPLPEPYVYFYAWPLPDGLMDEPLPAPAKWSTGDWKGATIDYGDLLQEPDPISTLEWLLHEIYAVAKERL